MSETTPVLGLQLTAAGQSQKHVTVNEALLHLDALVHLAVVERDRNAPPAAPAEGERYLVGAAPTGAFSGHAGAVAWFSGGAWSFHAPNAGWRAFVVAENALLIFDGTVWTGLTATGPLQNIERLGIATTADALNPLAVQANNALFTATPAPGGTGDLRFKLNKSATTNTLSQLYQTGFSGRAETGLIGDDHFAIKVSADGSLWKQALTIDPATGVVTAPFGLAGGGGGSATSPVVAKSAAYPVVAADLGKTIACAGTWTLSLAPAATLGNGFVVHARNTGSGVVTIDPSGVELVNGVATLALCSGEAVTLVCDGANWITRGRVGQVLVTAIDISAPVSTVAVALPVGFASFRLIMRRMKCATASPGGAALRASTDGGATWINTNGAYNWAAGYYSATATSQWGSASSISNAVPISPTELDTQASSMLLGEFLIEPGGGVSSYIQGDTMLIRPGVTSTAQNVVAAVVSTTARINALQFYQGSGGNWASGRIELYGNLA